MHPFNDPIPISLKINVVAVVDGHNAPESNLLLFSIPATVAIAGASNNILALKCVEFCANSLNK